MSPKFKLPETISSPQDLSSLVLELREYAKWFEHESIKRRKSVKETSELPALSPTTVKLIYELKATAPITQKSLDELIAAFEDYRQTAPTIAITLAAPPTVNVKKTLVAWCRENIAPNTLVSFQFNSTLLGGMVVRSGSRVFDWSFRRQILAARDKLPEVLRRG